MDEKDKIFIPPTPFDTIHQRIQKLLPGWDGCTKAIKVQELEAFTSWFEGNAFEFIQAWPWSCLAAHAIAWRRQEVMKHKSHLGRPFHFIDLFAFDAPSASLVYYHPGDPTKEDAAIMLRHFATTGRVIWPQE